MPAVRPRVKARRSYEGPTCPYCSRPVGAERSSGSRTCRKCGLRYQAVAFAPAADPGPLLILPQGALGGGAPCAQHASNAAEASCERCGTFMCQLCRIDSDGMVLCPACFDRLSGEGTLPSARRTYRDSSNIALTLALVGIPFMIAGVVLGPCAIWFAVRGLRQSRQPGVTVSRTRCVIAILVGAIVTLLGAAAILGLSGTFK